MWSSKGRFMGPSIPLAHEREENNVSNGWTVGQQHHQPIDPYALAAGRGQAVLERADVVLVHRMRLEVASRSILQLLFEAPPLLDGIVQLAEGIGHLETANVELEAFHRIRIVRPLLRER